MKLGFILYADAYDSIRSLDDTSKARLMDAIFLYIRGEELPEMNPVSEMAFSFIRRAIDRDRSKYAERCEKAAASAKVRWHKNNANASERTKRNAKHADNDTDPDPDPDERQNTGVAHAPLTEKEMTKLRLIVPPKVEWVVEYCKRNSLSVDAQYFVDYYTGLGWMRGKTKVKDWQSTLRTWAGRNQKVSSQGKLFPQAGAIPESEANALIERLKSEVFSGPDHSSAAQEAS